MGRRTIKFDKPVHIPYECHIDSLTFNVTGDTHDSIAVSEVVADKHSDFSRALDDVNRMLQERDKSKLQSWNESLQTELINAALTLLGRRVALPLIRAGIYGYELVEPGETLYPGEAYYASTDGGFYRKRKQGEDTMLTLKMLKEGRVIFAPVTEGEVLTILAELEKLGITRGYKNSPIPAFSYVSERMVVEDREVYYGPNMDKKYARVSTLFELKHVVVEEQNKEANRLYEEHMKKLSKQNPNNWIAGSTRFNYTNGHHNFYGPAVLIGWDQTRPARKVAIIKASDDKLLAVAVGNLVDTVI